MPGSSNNASALALDGWSEFNRIKWGVIPTRLRFIASGKSESAVETILYTDKRGVIVRPPLNPYVPVVLHLNKLNDEPKRYRAWLSLSSQIAEEYQRRGLSSEVPLPPGVTDVREWQWRDFTAAVRYTFELKLPLEPSCIDHAVRKQIGKATRAGYRWEQVSRFEDIMDCLSDTERRQKFQHRLTHADLSILTSLIGKDSLRSYVCYAPNGEAASARIVIHTKGAVAIDWVAGTKADHLQSGATQLLISGILDDLQAAGAEEFDYSGANIRSVAAAKATWGGALVPYFAIGQTSLKGIARTLVKTIERRAGLKQQRSSSNHEALPRKSHN